jgi:hypothetical protein
VALPWKTRGPVKAHTFLEVEYLKINSSEVWLIPLSGLTEGSVKIVYTGMASVVLSIA